LFDDVLYELCCADLTAQRSSGPSEFSFFLGQIGHTVFAHVGVVSQYAGLILCLLLASVKSFRLVSRTAYVLAITAILMCGSWHVPLWLNSPDDVP
jgi:hypothetical protein